MCKIYVKKTLKSHWRIQQAWAGGNLCPHCCRVLLCSMNTP